MAEGGEPEGEYAAKVGLADQTILMGATLSMDRLVGRMEKQVARTVVTHQLQHGDMSHFRDIAVRYFAKENPWEASVHILSATAKTAVSSEDFEFFKKIMEELLADACKPESSADLVPTDMSNRGNPDRRQEAKCWAFNHSHCDKPVKRGSCGSAANKKAHVCDVKMYDGEHCSRNHRHVDHLQYIAYERFLVVKAGLNLPDNEDLFMAIPEEIRKLGPLVTSANTVIVLNGYLRDWDSARKSAIYSSLAYDGNSICSQKRTKFWDGHVWSRTFYDRGDTALGGTTQDLSQSTVEDSTAEKNPRVEAVMVEEVIQYDPNVSQPDDYKLVKDQSGQMVWVKNNVTDGDEVLIIGKGLGPYKDIGTVLESAADTESPGPGATSTPARMTRQEKVQHFLKTKAANKVVAAQLTSDAHAIWMDQGENAANNSVAPQLEEAAETEPGAAAGIESNNVSMESVAEIQDDGEVGGQQDLQVEMVSVHKSYVRQQTQGNAAAVVDNMESKDVVYPKEVAAKNEPNLGRALTVHTADKSSRPVYSPGAPDFTCPQIEVNFGRLQGPNVAPVYPAGIRRGDHMLPNALMHRSALHWNLGHCPFPEPNENFRVYVRMAATEDQFVATSPLPVLKGIGHSYKEFREKRQCLQCSAHTKVGVLFVHTNDEAVWDVKNHWHCESCITESVLNLPPSCICITCLKVPYKLFYSSPGYNRATGTIVTEGFRRNVVSRGGREVMICATLPGHLTQLHQMLTGRLLQWVDRTKSEDDLINYREGVTFGEYRRREAEKAAAEKAAANTAAAALNAAGAAVEAAANLVAQVEENK